ncbi:MAG: hypothetical protein V5804_00355 [Mucilaginibacter sp.]|uniref:hypothetical protein n=1 Tax=Mucilaginibacter sp. TaxID=1882438 RepID=UPI0034E476DA
MKNKSILFSALVILFLTTACNSKHKNYGLGRQDTVYSGDSTNNIQNTVPPNDTTGNNKKQKQ